MADPMRIVADVLSAIADAHTPRAIVRAFAAGLAAHVALERVELQLSGAAIAVQRDGDDWTPTDLLRTAVELAPGLRVVAKRPLPRELTTAEVRDALGQIVAAATPHRLRTRKRRRR